MSGTHVIANQGGCTVWCEDCGETHNCENWPEARTLGWLEKHRTSCARGRQKRIRDTLRSLPNDVPEEAIAPIRAYADSLTRSPSGTSA